MSLNIDSHGRVIRKLRLSLLDACNFRCQYCMPEDSTFLPKENLMKREQIYSLSSNLVDLGVDEIRVTGGEPTLRSDFLDIMNDLSVLNLKKLCVTSNGTSIHKYLKELKQTKCNYINFSLDSLNRSGFHKITRRDSLGKVLNSILLAKELGFKVKVNMVVMKTINDHEILDFLDFAQRYDVNVRFLELMRIGIANDEFVRQFMSADEIISELNKKVRLTPKIVAVDSTSLEYLADNGAEIGFIASESKPFCEGCSRIRVSADGKIRACLMVNEGISVLDKTYEELAVIFGQTLKLKPTQRIVAVAQNMNQIGG
jgi:cyclic pyranopterin phosphate synthase